MESFARTDRWRWALIAAGVLSILFGLAAMLWPGLTFSILVFLFGIYAIVFGIVELTNMLRATGTPSPWWKHLLVGVFSVAAGVAVFVWPGETALVLLYIIAAWAVAVGIVEIGAAVSLNNLFVAMEGLVLILLGLVLVAYPGAGAVALVLIIGAFAIVRGVVLLVAAARSTATPAAR